MSGGNRSAHPSERSYPLCSLSNAASLQRATRPGLRSSARRSRSEHIIGVVVSDTTSEMPIDTESVTANSRKRRPTIPPMKRIGMKTATSDTLMETTVNATSRAPSSAASKGSIPFSIWRETFSRTTIASSTTNPVAMVSAMSERLFRLNPRMYIAANVPMSEIGTATAGISVARPLRRKTNTTRITSATEIMSVRSTSCSEARMVLVRSSITCRSMLAGMDARSSGRSSVMLSTTSMMLAFGWRLMIISTAGLPFAMP